MKSREEILITVDELAKRIESERDLPAGAPRTRVLDVRWALTLPGARKAKKEPSEPVGLSEFKIGHIPTAVFVDLDRELAGHGSPEAGSHPMPSLKRLQNAAKSWGINEGDDVVVYDGRGNLSSARAWWLLHDAGLKQVYLLDGSLPAWHIAGYPIEVGEHAHTPGNIVLESGHLPRLELSEIEQFLREDGVLLDARDAENYRGDVEPIAPRKGHIPGARNTPATGNIDADGFFLPKEMLQAKFSESGADGSTPVASYCGVGVTAAHNVVALAIAGIDAALYMGSWSQWSNHPELPTEIGPEATRPKV